MVTKSSDKTCISVAAGLPAGYTQTDVDAMTFTQVGELKSFGDLNESVNITEVYKICKGVNDYSPGKKSMSTVDISAEADADDAGQVIVSNGFANKSAITLKVTDSDGAELVMVAYVASRVRSYAEDQQVAVSFTVQPLGNFPAPEEFMLYKAAA